MKNALSDIDKRELPEFEECWRRVRTHAEIDDAGCNRLNVYVDNQLAYRTGPERTGLYKASYDFSDGQRPELNATGPTLPVSAQMSWELIGEFDEKFSHKTLKDRVAELLFDETFTWWDLLAKF